VAFSAGEVTTRLVDREVIFRPGEVNGRDQSKEAIVRLFESGFAGKRLSSFHLDKTTSLGITLLNQIALHSKILSHVLSPLQMKRTL
jgi:hypothetical protein